MELSNYSRSDNLPLLGEPSRVGRCVGSGMNSGLKGSLGLSGALCSCGKALGALRFGEVAWNDASTAQQAVDPVAVCEFPTRYAFFGNRTLLRGTRRSDLYSRGGKASGFTQFIVPPHGNREASPAEIAEGLGKRLLSETGERAGHGSRVGLLLSGGMDSRFPCNLLLLGPAGNEGSNLCTPHRRKVRLEFRKLRC